MKFIRKKRTYLSAFIFVLTFFMIGMIRVNVSAKNDTPVGGMWIPEREEIETIVIDDTEKSLDDNPNLLRGSAVYPLDAVPVETGPHYEYLSQEEKILYEAIYSLISTKKYIPYSKRNNVNASDVYSNYSYVIYSGNKSFSEVYGISSMNSILNRVQEALYFDHPGNVEFYMCMANYGIVTRGNGTVESYVYTKAYFDDTQFAKINTTIQNSLNTIVADIQSKNLADANWPAITELNVHDYFSKMVSYDNDAANDSGYSGYFNVAHTAYGSLYNKKAVCDGYSTGYQMILEKLGIDAMVIAGKATTSSSGSGGGHAWNIVRLDGLWYEADTTWASTSSGGTVSHDYFNKTTSEYANGIKNHKHIRTENQGYVGYRMPVATGTHYTYSYITQNSSAMQKDSDYIAVQGIGISAEAMEVDEGTNFTIKPTFTPENASIKEYTYESSDQNVVKVNGKMLYANSAGTANITIKATDGGFTKTCAVTVKAVQNQTDDTEQNNGSGQKDNSGQNGGNQNAGGSGSGDNSQSGDNGQQGGGQSGNSDQQGGGQGGNSDQQDGGQSGNGDQQSGGQSDNNDQSQGSSNQEAPLPKAAGTYISYSVSSENGTYFVNDEEATVTLQKVGKKNASSLTIPQVITDENGLSYTVTQIGSKLKKGNKKLKKLVIPKTVTTIGNNAFANCTKLKTIRIYADNLTTVRSGAFKNINGKCKITIIAANKKQYNKIVKKLKKAGAKNATFAYKKG
ncbi:leucine-rich repeat protein [Butyrivibrio sp. WCE2006]|uniref:leucine-rich repeat protein n=1 Tax=Butyrivibrio sp. WCE2006 TaxID=1410611 RepID=UPI0005D1FBE7|nr:leucine-rich repeat protein [Butyrivibrio sp. WCE2006]